jgi:hypothetical protein
VSEIKVGEIIDIDGGSLSVFIDCIKGEVVSFTVVDGPSRMIGKSFKSTADELRDRIDGSLQISPIELP